ncbi:MAG: flagellar M-ring protein FliF [Syntrophales bacterium]|nr:flagellar M-ring protein FliF [Syntrophales bacterium]
MTFAIVTLASISLFTYSMNRKDYKVLFSDLANTDANRIVLRLQEKKIPYKISPSGDSLLVPAELVPELRIEMAASGLTQGGAVGFEIFDKKNFGATEFVQKLNYRRALQGELARTVNSLDEIAASRVHIAIPEKSLFVEESTNPSASVVVKLKPGRKLQGSQVEGIVNLVAASVENLSPENVMVVDNNGNIISQSAKESGQSVMDGTQIEYQRNVEKGLAGRVQKMLERVVGKGKVVAAVAARLDFGETERTEEIFGSEDPAIRSLQRKTEKSKTPLSEGESSVSVKESPMDQQTVVNREKTNEIINYEVNRIVSKTVKPVGEIEKLSVAVMVDGVYVKNDKGNEEYQSRTKKEMELLEELVKKAVGFDARRGDQVVLSNIAFKRTDMEGILEEGKSLIDKLASLLFLLKFPLLLLSLVLTVFFVFKPVLKFLLDRGGEIESKTEQIMAAAGAELHSPLPTLKLENAKNENMPEITAVKAMARQDSRTFSELLRNWLN